MDVQSIYIALGAFIIFLLLLMVVFRITPPDTHIQVIFRTSLFVCVMLCAFLAVYIYPYSIVDVVPFTIFTLGIYGTLIILFVLSVYSAFEASLTIRYLHIIAQSVGGISRSALLSQYGIETIVNKRLARMVVSKDIRLAVGEYTLNASWSFFRLREVFFKIYSSCFP